MKTQKLLIILLALIAWFYSTGQNFMLAGAPDDFGSPPLWQWAKNFGGSGIDYGNGVITDENGNIYVTGAFSGKIYLDFDTLTSYGRWDAFVAKYSSSGSLIWFRQYPPDSPENRTGSNAIYRDGEGNLYITGYYSGWVTIGDFTLPDYTSGMNFFFARLDENGNAEFAANPNLTFLFSGICIKTDETGNILIIGSNVEKASSMHLSTLVCYGPSGDLSWSYFSDASFYDLEIYGSKIFYSGTFPQGGSPIGDFVLEPYSRDAFLARSDLAGNFEWAKIPSHEGLYSSSEGKSIYMDGSGNIYQCGGLSTDVIFGQTTLTGYGGFIVKADQNGNYLWANSLEAAQNFNTTKICGNNEFAMVSSGYSMYKVNCMSGLILDENTMDYNPAYIHYCYGTNRVIATGNLFQEIFFSALDADLNQIWMKQIHGDTGYGHNIGGCTDHNGHFYAFSYASAKMDYFGQMVDEGLILSKQDLSGNVEWLKQFQGATQSPNCGCYIKMDTLHNSLYLTGVFSDPFTIPGVTTLIPGEYGGFYIMKYDPEGNYQWHVQGDGYIRGNCLSVDHSGNVLLSGTFDYIMNIGDKTLTSAGDEDAFISKFDLNGNLLWAIRGGGEYTEYVGLISTDQNDNIYFTGEFTSVNVTLDDQAITLNEGDGNVFFAKLSPDGDVIWMDSKAGSLIAWGDEYCWPTSIITDPEGYTYIKGWHHDSTYFDGILLTNPFSIKKMNNYFIAKFDPLGQTIWARSISESRSGFDYNQMDTDNAGNVYFGAQISDTVWFGDDYMYACGGYQNGYRDLFIAKYTPVGELDWVRVMNASLSEWGSSIPTISCLTVLDEDRLIMGGKFNNYLDLSPYTLNSLNTHGMIAFLGEPTWISESGKMHSREYELFPNPSTSMVTIRLAEPESDICMLTISDLSGRNIIKTITVITSGEACIDVSSLTPGAYIITLHKKRMIGSKMLIVE